MSLCVMCIWVIFQMMLQKCFIEEMSHYNSKIWTHLYIHRERLLTGSIKLCTELF